MVNIRLGAMGKRPKLTFPSVGVTGAATPSCERSAYFSSASKPVTAMVYRRDHLGAGARVAGPALIQEHGTTTVLFENDACQVAASGELIVDVGDAR